MNQEKIDEIRKKIDEIDAILVPLLEQRLKCSVAIGKEKVLDHKPMYDELREKAIFLKVEELVTDIHYKEEVHQIYRFLLDLSKRTQFKHIGK